MMGRQTGDQSQLFYLFNLEERIPANHLLRRINPVVTWVLAELRSRPPSTPAIHHGVACIIPIVGRNMPPKPIAPSYESRAS
jgi:hypothetical protein